MPDKEKYGLIPGEKSALNGLGQKIN